jgi:hypothetical protein
MPVMVAVQPKTEIGGQSVVIPNAKFQVPNHLVRRLQEHTEPDRLSGPEKAPLGACSKQLADFLLGFHWHGLLQSQQISVP